MAYLSGGSFVAIWVFLIAGTFISDQIAAYSDAYLRGEASSRDNYFAERHPIMMQWLNNTFWTLVAVAIATFFPAIWIYYLGTITVLYVIVPLMFLGSLATCSYALTTIYSHKRLRKLVACMCPYNTTARQEFNDVPYIATVVISGIVFLCTLAIILGAVLQ